MFQWFKFISSKLSWLTTGNEIKKELSKVSSSIFDLPNGNPLRQQLSDSKAQLESHVDKKLVLFLINFCFVPHIGPYTCCVPNPPNHENIYIAWISSQKKMLLAQDQFRHRRQHWSSSLGSVERCGGFQKSAMALFTLSMKYWLHKSA